VSIGARQVNLGLDQTLWPALRAYGFDQRTQRTAWRHRQDAVDIVEVHSIGALHDDVGCTQIASPRIRLVIGHSNCYPFVHTLNKTLSQTWLKPLTQPPERLSEPMQIHREALKPVLRTDVHDRLDVWFVLEDGSNLDEELHDLGAVVRDKGIPIPERFHDPEQVIQMAANDELHALAQLGWR